MKLSILVCSLLLVSLTACLAATLEIYAITVQGEVDDPTVIEKVIVEQGTQLLPPRDIPQDGKILLNPTPGSSLPNVMIAVEITETAGMFTLNSDITINERRPSLLVSTSGGATLQPQFSVRSATHHGITLKPNTWGIVGGLTTDENVSHFTAFRVNQK